MTVLKVVNRDRAKILTKPSPAAKLHRWRTRWSASTVALFAWDTLDQQHLGGAVDQGPSEADRHKISPFRAIPAHSTNGGAEPLWQQDAQILLIVTDPRHVAVRSQQRGGYVEFGAFVGDGGDPICPARNLQLAGLVEQPAAPAVHQPVEAPPLGPDIPQPATDKRMPPAEVVADPDRCDLPDQVAVDLLEVHQFRYQPEHRLGARFGGQQFRLRAGVVQHGGGHRVLFGVVAVQQPLGSPAADLGSQFPAEGEGGLDAEGEALSAYRRGGWGARGRRPPPATARSSGA